MTNGQRHAVAVLLSVLVSVGLLTACSNGSEAGAGASTSTAGTTQSLVAAPPTTPPTKIRNDTPLQQEPPEGKVVGMVYASNPTSDFYIGQVNDAATALRWTTKSFLYTTDPGGALQSAVDAGVDYIFANNLVIEAVTHQLEQAKAAGIPVIVQGSAGTSDPVKGYYVTAASPIDFTNASVDWIVNDSGGKANATFVTISAYPIFKTTEGIMRDRFSEECPGCVFDILDVTPNEMTNGQIPSIVASYLQSHREVNYLRFAYSDMVTGVVPALDAAGLLEGLTITGASPTNVPLTDIANGQKGGWVAIANGVMPWQAIDIAARLSVGEQLTSSFLASSAVYETPVDPWIIATPEVAEKYKDEPYGWAGPDGYQDQYAALWKVGS